MGEVNSPTLVNAFPCGNTLGQIRNSSSILHSRKSLAARRCKPPAFLQEAEGRALCRGSGSSGGVRLAGTDLNNWVSRLYFSFS